MKKTLKQYLTESQKLPHWPKTLEELQEVYKKVSINDETGEVMMHPISKYDPLVIFNDDLTVSLRRVHSNDRVQIADWMLVDGMLPFPFKDVDCAIVVNKDCGLKSFAGFPRKCNAISIEENGLHESVKDLTGCSEEVKFSLSIFACGGIESLNGFPKHIVEDEFNLSVRFCSNFKDFSHIPRKLEKLNIGATPHFTEEDFKYLSPEVETISFDNLKNLKSLHNIHKYVKSAKCINLYETKIFSSILGLSLIKGLTEVDESFYDINNDDKSWPTDGIIEIVEKYMGTQDVFEFQEALVEAGFNELAKL